MALPAARRAPPARPRSPRALSVAHCGGAACLGDARALGRCCAEAGRRLVDARARRHGAHPAGRLPLCRRRRGRRHLRLGRRPARRRRRSAPPPPPPLPLPVSRLSSYPALPLPPHPTPPPLLPAASAVLLRPAAPLQIDPCHGPAPPPPADCAAAGASLVWGCRAQGGRGELHVGACRDERGTGGLRRWDFGGVERGDRAGPA